MSGYLLKNSDNFSQVADIPKTFPSVSDYTNSFVYTLLEETHADLLSNIQGINHSPTAKIVSVQSSEDFKPPEALLYAIILKRRQGSYVPDGGDLIALTDVRPKSVDDLKRPNKSYIVALVQSEKINNSTCKLFVLSSKLINQQLVEGVDGKARRSITILSTSEISDKHYVRLKKIKTSVVQVNGDQEVFIVPVLQQREIYRHLDSANRVYNKDLIVPHGIHSEHVKEKKKGIFSSMMKGSKPQHERET